MDLLHLMHRRKEPRHRKRPQANGNGLFLKVILIIMNKIVHLKVSLDLVEFEAPKFVKVKTHKRVRNGKIVKVCSHYRRVWGRT